MSRVPSQNLSIMMTDIQGYSAKSAETSRANMIHFIRSHNKLMVPVVEFYGGKIIKSIGDAFLCTFKSATDAVICSIIIQLLLKEFNQQQTDETLKMTLRVVVNSGDVTLEEGDIFGNAVNVTSRMEGLSCFPGGTIGISESTYLLMDKTEVKANKIGPQKLKGIPEPINVYSVPCENQKLSSLPAHLLDLVKKVVNMEDDKDNSAFMSQWKNSVAGYLKESGWGGDFGANFEKAGKHLKQNFNQASSKISSTLSQKTVADKDQKKQKQASISTRIKCFVIDAILLFAVYLIINIAWWPVNRIVFGAAYINYNEYRAEVKANYKEANERYKLDRKKGEYLRKQSIAERLINLNISFPFVLFCLYFAIFWAVKGATVGQLVGKTAVVMEDGSKVPISIAISRSFLFNLSALFLFAGMITIFFGEKQTFYDKISNTKVIE